MTASPAILLLADLARRGITVVAAGSKLRYQPRDRVTTDLLERMVTHKDDLLAILPPAHPSPPRSRGDISSDAWMPDERRLISGCSPEVRQAVCAAKTAFVHAGGLTLVSVRPFKSAARDEVAHRLRCVREHVGGGGTADVRDAWRDRLKTCVDDGLTQAAAEVVALEEVRQKTWHLNKYLVSYHSYGKKDQIRE